MKVRIVVYKGQIAISTKAPMVRDDDWFPREKGSSGCVLCNTRVNLGISLEAWELLKKLPPPSDGAGTLMLFQEDQEGYVLSWEGDANQILPPSATFETPFFGSPPNLEDFCTVIPNALPIQTFVTPLTVTAMVQVGDVQAIASADLFGAQWHLTRVLVEPENQRGQGVGSKLLQALLDKIGDQGGNIVWVVPGGYGEDAQRQVDFFLRNGFAASDDPHALVWARVVH